MYICYRNNDPVWEKDKTLYVTHKFTNQYCKDSFDWYAMLQESKNPHGKIYYDHEDDAQEIKKLFRLEGYVYSLGIAA